MKVSLVTLHRVFNYGSFLQTYALQTYLQKMGYEVEVVDYKPERFSNKEFFWDRNPKGLRNIFLLFLYNIAVFPKKFFRKRMFDQYVVKFINLTKRQYHTFGEIIEDTPQADVYLTGSDQVWNTDHNRKVDPVYFVDYAPEGKKRIAYAASFGKEQLDNLESPLIKALIHKYDAISVRESSAKDILETLGWNNSLHVVDPTLLLDQTAWSEIMGASILKENYLLIYQLENNEFMFETAKKIAKAKNLKIAKLTMTYNPFISKENGIDYILNNVTPSDFLSLFANSKFIVTNSFHGSAFAINFNKELIVVPPAKYATRLISLMETMKIVDRIIIDHFDLNIIMKPIDFSKINAKLQEDREEAGKFLRESILEK